MNFLKILYKLLENLTSYKIWLMVATFYLQTIGKINLTGWEWVVFVFTMAGARVGEYLVNKNNENGIK